MAVEREEAQVEVVELDEPGRELALREVAQPGGVFAVREPAEMVAQAAAVANVLKDIVAKAGLVKRIGTKDYMLVEAWTTLGTLVGCTARTEWSRQIEGGWEAAVEVVNANGLVIGRAEASCLRSERNWKDRDDYALRSMAQTRAMGKALRMPLGWIAVLAGYEATPAEEMPTGGDKPVETRTVPAPAPNPTPAGEQKKVTTRQLGKIAPLKRELEDAGAVSEAAYRKVLKDEYGVESATELTAAQASNLIERLEAKREKLRVPAEPAQGTLA